MKAKNVGLIVAACFATTFLVMGYALFVAWETVAPALPEVLQANVAQPPPGRNAFNFDALLVPELQVPQEEPLPRENLPQVRGKVVGSKTALLSGPHTHGNLTIFLIHGQDALKDANILTLQEAVEQNRATVHDIGTGQLFIDNRDKAPLFIQSGDIVKGGIQDRTLPYDMVVPPLANQLPLTALCVEKDRSRPRGDELSSSFQTTTEQLPGKKLRLAAYRHSQQDVWNNVALLQDKLKRNLDIRVLGVQSPSSLQLTLETPRVQQAVQDCVGKLAPALEGHTDVIGFVVAVNGKVHSADVYGSSALFEKLWPKLIRASTVEALAEQQKGLVFDAPGADTVKAFLAGAEQGPAFRREVEPRTVMVRQETAQVFLLDTCDPTQQNVVLHRTILSK